MMVYPAGLDAIEVDALQTDRYLDALLSAVDRRAYDVPADPAVDPTLRLAARRLRDEVVRTHPSFRFEERLARRLADAAARMRLATAGGGEVEAAIIPFRTPLLTDPPLAAATAASADGTPSPFRPIVARPLLVGGALAGAAFVAWRLTRGAPTDPMAATTAVDAALGQRRLA